MKIASTDYAPIAAVPVPSLSADQMREVDRLMIEELGVTLLQMMENAGRSLAQVARSRFLEDDARGRRVLVLCGAGGNGGGGLVCARRLHNWGADVRVLLSVPPAKLGDVPQHQLRVLDAMGVEAKAADEPLALPPSDLIVDALIDYSLRGGPDGVAAALVRAANTHSAPILALDVPHRTRRHQWRRSGAHDSRGRNGDHGTPQAGTRSGSHPRYGWRALSGRHRGTAVSVRSARPAGRAHLRPCRPRPTTLRGAILTVEMVLACDLGGTRLRFALVQTDGSVLSRHVIPTPSDDPGALARGLREMLGGADGGVRGVVVGVPGPIDYDRGEVLTLPNLPGWDNAAISARSLSAEVGVRVLLANDADLAALGEYRYGAGRGSRDMVYITSSTGVGAGVIIGGRLLHGRQSLAEVGHTIIDMATMGTVESLGSGTAVAHRSGRSASEVATLAAEGDEEASGHFRAAATGLAVGVFNAVHSFAPDTVVIGGGMSQAGDLLLGPSKTCCKAVPTAARGQRLRWSEPPPATTRGSRALPPTGRKRRPGNAVDSSWLRGSQALRARLPRSRTTVRPTGIVLPTAAHGPRRR